MPLHSLIDIFPPIHQAPCSRRFLQSKSDFEVGPAESPEHLRAGALGVTRQPLRSRISNVKDLRGKVSLRVWQISATDPRNGACNTGPEQSHLGCIRKRT